MTILLVAIAWTRVSNFLAAVAARITALSATAGNLWTAAWEASGTPRYQGRHRGTGRATRASNRVLRDGTEVSKENAGRFVALEPKRYDQSAGDPQYQRLKPAMLEAGIAEIVLTRTETFPLRGATPAFGDIGDREYEEAMS